MTMFKQDWITIPAGEVSLAAGGYLREAATVEVAPFAISRTPVTNEQYGQFIAAAGYETSAWWCEEGWALRQKGGWSASRYWGGREWTAAECPVVGVSWYEARAFCRWLSAHTGQEIGLPEEAQWQRAAQGDDDRPYPWGGVEPDDRRCNWQRQVDETTPVTRYPAGASPFGVLDMSGNVWEWCLTGWQTGTTAAGREARLLRGGCWSSDSAWSLHVANRSAIDPNTRLDPAYRNHVTVGFRCVRLL